MIETGLVNRERLLSYFMQIEPQLYRFPAINAARFAERVRKLQ